MVMWRRRNVAVVVAVVLLLLEALFIRVTAVKDPSPPHEREEDYDYYCSTETDRVTVVPGYPALQPPGGCWYSGYLHYEVAGQQIHTHYTLQVAEPWTDSDLDDDAVPHGRRPSNQSKPLIYWSSYVSCSIIYFYTRHVQMP